MIIGLFSTIAIGGLIYTDLQNRLSTYVYTDLQSRLYNLETTITDKASTDSVSTVSSGQSTVCSKVSKGCCNLDSSAYF